MRLAAVITVSDRSAAGEREDASGPVAVEHLQAAGWECPPPRVVADGIDSVESALRAALAEGARLIITSGGTGVSPRDQTPEASARVIERELPGIAEELRRRGGESKPAALLTRGLAGTARGAFIVNLPGKPAAVADGMPLILAVADHVVDQLAGGDH